jgi:hypothetical protein
MKGPITKIDKKKWGNGAYFTRVYFELERPGSKWAKTDLVEDNRNWNDWKNVLKVGNILENLELLDDTTVNADSVPRLAGFRPPPPVQGMLF